MDIKEEEIIQNSAQKDKEGRYGRQNKKHEQRMRKSNASIQFEFHKAIMHLWRAVVEIMGKVFQNW